LENEHGHHAEACSIRPAIDAETDPALSPDGRWLAYTSNRTGGVEVWVQRYPEHRRAF
jgi:hypothetical protein